MWLLTFTLGPSPEHSPCFVLLASSPRNSLGWILHSWSIVTSLVSLGDHIVAGDYLPFGAAIQTFYLLLPLVLAEPGEGQ